MQLDDNLKQLMKELGAAINDALSEYEEISEAIQNVRNAGYDVFLVLEATIGFNKTGSREGGEQSTFDFRVERPEPVPLKMTPLDKKFLRSLKITVDARE